MIQASSHLYLFERLMPSRGVEPATLCSTSAIWCCTCVKQLFWLLTPWYWGREVGLLRDPEVVGHLVCTRPTTWAKSIQTTAPLGLGYSTLLAFLDAQGCIALLAHWNFKCYISSAYNFILSHKLCLKSPVPFHGHKTLSPGMLMVPYLSCSGWRIGWVECW